MNAQTRRNLATVLVGVAGSLVALAVITYLKQDACLDAGGRWDAATRACVLPGGSPRAATSAWSYLTGIVAGVVVAIVLWRAFTFFATRRERRG